MFGHCYVAKGKNCLVDKESLTTGAIRILRVDSKRQGLHRNVVVGGG